MFRHYFSAALWPNYGPFAGLLVACLLGIAPKASAQVGSVPGLDVQEVGKGITPTIPVTLDGPGYHGPGAVIYIDGKRSNDSTLVKLNPDDIADITILKHGVGSLLKPTRKQVGAFFITTRAGLKTQAVHQFNKRMAKLAANSANAMPVVD
jgi:hypothetical protein